MKKLIKVMVYLDTEAQDMTTLLKDFKYALSSMAYGIKGKYGLASIKVTTTGFQADKDPAWGLETPIR